MDPLPVVTSIAQDPAGSTVAENPVRIQPVRTGIRSLKRILLVLFLGIGIGVLASLCVLYLPYDRIVVRGQPMSPVMSISSAHLRDGGFVVLYLNTDAGWELVGHSGYLRSGYHRNIRIPIDITYVVQYRGRSFNARLYRDTGNQWLSEQDDIPVNNMYGSVYQKRFWFLYPGNSVKQAWGELLDSPASFIVDQLIP